MNCIEISLMKLCDSLQSARAALTIIVENVTNVYQDCPESNSERKSFRRIVFKSRIRDSEKLVRCLFLSSKTEFSWHLENVNVLQVAKAVSVQARLLAARHIE